MRNRIHYPPGIISLTITPLLCIWFFNKINAFDKKEKAMDVLYWGANMDEYTLTKDVAKRIQSFRKYNQIGFTNDEANNQLKLDYASREIKKMVSTNDTLTGIQFLLDHHTKYRQLVKIIEICLTEKANYLFNKNDIWIYNQTLVTPKINPSPILYDCIQIDNAYLNEKAQSEEWHLNYMRFCSLFIVLTIVLLTSLVKKCCLKLP